VSESGSAPPVSTGKPRTPAGATPRTPVSTGTPRTPEPARRPKKKRRVPVGDAPAARDVERSGDSATRTSGGVAAGGAKKPAAEPEEAYVPSFARDFPRHPELDALVAAFEAGNYARVRVEAPALAARADEPAAVREAARELRRRLDPDPLAAVMIGLAVALLAFFAIYYWTHGHAVP
jgi:hypothetical protein